MTWSAFRSLLYTVAKYMGDLGALGSAVRRGSLLPIFGRILRRLIGRALAPLVRWRL